MSQRQRPIGPMTKKQAAKAVRKSLVQNIGKKQIKKIKKQLGLKTVNIRGTRPNAQRVSGRGAYSFGDLWSDIKRPFVDNTASQGAINTGARGLGTAIGNELGGSVGGKLLGNASSWLARAFGFGDYTIKSNSLAAEGQNIAQFAGHGTIEFAHREFIADISSSTGFVNTSYPINPGNQVLFPWLSTVAKNFEQYEMLGLIFEFKSTSATAVGSVNTGLGTVIMATDYDVLDVPYPDKRSMEVSEFSTSAAPYNHQIHPIECDPKMNVMRSLFINPGNNVSTYPDDPRFSAMGNFQIATAGMQAVSVIGELWVSYHIRLLKPQIDESVGTTTTTFHQKLVQPAAGPLALSSTASNNLGAIVPSLVGIDARMTVATPAGTGTYMLTIGAIMDVDLGVYITFGPPIFGGGAALVSNAYTNTGTSTRNSAWLNIPSAKTDSILAQAYNPVSFALIVTLPSVGSYVDIRTPISAANVYIDVYLTPYTVPGLADKPPTGIVELNTEVQKIQQQLESFKLLMKSSNNSSSNSSSTPRDWLKVDTESEKKTIDLLVSAAISTIEKDRLESLALTGVKDRISGLEELLNEDSLDMSQRIYLSNHLRLCKRRLIELA